MICTGGRAIGVDASSARGEGYCPENALDKGGEAANGAHDFIVRTLVGASVVLHTVFLIFERDGDTRRVGQLWVAVGNGLVMLVAEVDASQIDDFGSSWLGCGRKFTRPHGIEERRNS